jgi:primosomal protein N' (replication factor Y)
MDVAEPNPCRQPAAPGTAFEGVRVAVAVDAPGHSEIDGPLSYASASALPPGTLVRVPLGRRDTAGIVWSGPAADPSPAPLRPVRSVVDALPPLSAAWQALVDFSARYYQRQVGELALSVLPPELRRLTSEQVQERLRKLQRALSQASSDAPAPPLPQPPQPTHDQLAALAAIGSAEPGATLLLHGVTGSGKTEVYLRAAAAQLARGRQVLVLVPEINLTPQLEARFAARFPDRRLVALHSRLTPAQRLRHWLAAHLGHADLVLGTRLAIFTSLPRLGLIVVDEEHDPSYKQQEGARYSARDLAVFRGRLERVVVLLGSATPSLESWQRAEQGRYGRVEMPARVGEGPWPALRIADMHAAPRDARAPALAPTLLEALRQRLARGEQSLVLLNRRGYAPVLHCPDCGWKSACPHCSAWQVFHKADRSLRCHHCAATTRVPRACPTCGNLDIAPIGRGTERLEEQLAALLAHPDGRPARLARLDADTTRARGTLEARLEAVHAGEVDVLVGTQMIAKGHDFRRVTLVAAVNPDASLFSSDFRAPERLFALLMQAAGRAGRDVRHAQGSEMWIQTWHPTHALYAALARHDFASFARAQLAERAVAGLPPWSHLAMLRAEARSADAARAFLDAATVQARQLDPADRVLVYPPVPLPIARVADVERQQMLVESSSRNALQAFLAAWLPRLRALRHGGGRRVLRWAVDVDPLVI